MKIALIGNINNNFFAFMRYFRDYGLDTSLFILSNECDHFMPSCDTFDLEFRKYTHDLNLGNPYWFLNEIEKLENEYYYQIEQLREYDIIFACSSALGFLEYFNIKVNFFVPAGIDLYSFPFHIDSANPNHKKHLDTFSFYQRKSIESCDKIFSSNDILLIDIFKNSIDKLSSKEKVITYSAMPIIYHKIYNKENISKNYEKSYWYNDFKKIKNSSDLVIFHHSRHIWKTYVDKASNKSNDKVILAFSKIVEKYTNLNPKLVLFDYGNDVIHSKILIKELNIEANIEWMPKMNRKDIMVGISLSDIVAGDYSCGWAMGGTIIEALISEKPLLHYIDETKFNINEYYPFLNAKTSTEIFNQIEYYISNKQDCLNKAEEAYNWVIGNTISNSLVGIIKEIDTLQKTIYN